MKENPQLKLELFGQIIWKDFIRRGIIGSGQPQQLIEVDGLGGGLLRRLSQRLVAGQSHPGATGLLRRKRA